MKQRLVLAVGKRKRAIARAKALPGKGNVKINSVPLDLWGNEALRLWIKEPLVLAGDWAKKLDVHVNVRGGGLAGQAEAIRMAIARSLIEFYPELKSKFLEFDRGLLVYDPRRCEPHKPSRSKAGARRHKQRSKR